MFQSRLTRGAINLSGRVGACLWGTGAAVVAVGLAGVAAWFLWDRTYPLVTPPFLAAIALAAIVGGMRSGMVATALAACVVVWMTESRGDLAALGLSQVVWGAAFVVMALAAGALNSARRSARRLLRERDERLRLISEQIPAGLWSTDASLRLTTRFGAGLEMLQGPGQCLVDLFPGAAEDFPPIVAHRRALSGIPNEYELEWDGRVYQCHVEPLRNDDGEVIGVVGVALDISDRKRFERGLEEAKASAEQATAAKDRFLAMLSHELRTPLTPALVAATSLEGQQRVPPDVRQDLAVIRRSIEMEARLIDDLLDLSRVATGKLRLTRATADVHDVLKAAVETCRADMEARKIGLKLDLRAEYALVWCDAARMQQVVWNLLKNAVKFTPERGRIVVRS